MAQLSSHFAGTGYAPRAALLLAKLLCDTGDKAGAKAQLQWVIDRRRRGAEGGRALPPRRGAARREEVRRGARTLDAKHPDAFAGLYADLRGDALVAAGRAAEARTAYQTALAKLDAKSSYRNYVQVKLDALGGAWSRRRSCRPARSARPPATAPAAAPAVPAAAPAQPKGK